MSPAMRTESRKWRLAVHAAGPMLGPRNGPDIEMAGAELVGEDYVARVSAEDSCTAQNAYLHESLHSKEA